MSNTKLLVFLSRHQVTLQLHVQVRRNQWTCNCQNTRHHPGLLLTIISNLGAQ